MPRKAETPAGQPFNGFRDLLKTVGWSRPELAERLGVHTSTIDGWCRDRTPDPAVEGWLLRLAQWHRLNPRPPGWTPRKVGRRAAEKCDDL